MTHAIRFWLVLLTLWGSLALMASRPAQAAFDPNTAYTISWFYAAAFGRTPVPNSTSRDYGNLGGLTY